MFLHCCEHSEPHVRLPSQTKGLGIPRESGLEGQQGFDYRSSRGLGNQRLQSWRAQTKLCMHQDPEERSSDPKGD